jgi:capsular exopolysaccharide synthesis family protein
MSANGIIPTRTNAIIVERILQTLLRRVSTIILVTVVIIGSALAFSLAQAPTYEASIKVLVNQNTTEDPRSLGGDISGLQAFTLTVADAAETTTVAQGVVEQLNLPEGSANEVLKNMSVEPDPGTTFVNISYKDSDPAEAQQGANAIGQVLSQSISEVSPGANAITATVFEQATLPQTPVSPNPVRNGLLALVLGSLLGVMLAFLLEYVDDRWNSPEEVEEFSGLPTFGVIPRVEVPASKKNKGEQVALLDPPGAASEAYRSLRTSLLYAVVDEPLKVILITSAGSADGKSITCANLAMVLAQAGKETLVIDGDLRYPSVHRIFGERNVSGVVNVLAGEHDLSEVWKEPFPHLKIISAGTVPPNPAEHLTSGRFAELVGQARGLFDYVLIDSPPTGAVSDPMIIATQADAVLLVVDSEGTSKRLLRKAMRNLEAVGAKVIGTVMNKAPKAEVGRYDYGDQKGIR